MKSSIISSASSSKTPATAATASFSFTSGCGRDRSEGRGDSSCYFPGCRKDTNCNCKICLASINATLDLIPTGSSITKLSSLAKRAAPPPPPVMEPATPPATPNLIAPTSSFSLTPPIESTAKSRPLIRGVPGKTVGFCFLGHWKMMVFLGIFLFTAVDLGSLKGVMEGFGPKLTKEILEQFGEESRGQLLDLRGKLRIMELKIGRVVDGGVLNCSSLNSIWEMNQVGHQFFHWRCVIYESMSEEVSVWGSPLRTSGLISTGFYSRSLALLSGRITEWSDGKLEATSRTGNGSSWTLQRWMTVAVQLESDTWVVEYKRSVLFEDPKLLPSALKMLRSRSIKMFKLLKQEPWRVLSFISLSDAFYHPEENAFMHPT